MKNTIAFQSVTLNGNKVIQYKGNNLYFSQDGTPLGMEQAWYRLENPIEIPTDVAEYMLDLVKKKKLFNGMYFVGYVQRITNTKYRIISWDHTFIILESENLKEIEDFIFANSRSESEIEGYEEMAVRVPFDKNGILFEDTENNSFGSFYKDCRKFNWE